MHISQHPIRLSGRHTLYSYVHDPNGWVDVFGLARKPVASRLPEGDRTGIHGPENGVLVNRNPQIGELIQIRTYDSNGNPVKDIDFGHDHGFGDPHAHDWNYPSGKAPNKTRSDGRVLDDDDQALMEGIEDGTIECG